MYRAIEHIRKHWLYRSGCQTCELEVGVCVFVTTAGKSISVLVRAVCANGRSETKLRGRARGDKIPVPGPSCDSCVPSLPSPRSAGARLSGCLICAAPLLCFLFKRCFDRNKFVLDWLSCFLGSTAMICMILC